MNRSITTVFVVKDVTVSTRYYVKYFDFKSDVLSVDTGYAQLSYGNSILALLELKVAAEMTDLLEITDKQSSLIALEIDSIDKFVSQYGKVLDIVTKPKTTSWGQYVAYIVDPDGHIIEIADPFKE